MTWIARLRREPIAVRLFFSVWLVYTIHFASDVARETYLAISLGKSFSFRVDEYLGLHPDLFEMEGQGAHINNNPGASMVGALPYAAARPLIEAFFALKPELREPKPPTVYDDPRPNRNPFLNAVRERGLDIELGLIAASIHAGLMVPLGAAAALLVFLFLRRTLGDERRAIWLALLYAFGTPIFFRSAYLNQNVLIAHAVLLAYVLAARLVDYGGGRTAGDLRRETDGGGFTAGDERRGTDGGGLTAGDGRRGTYGGGLTAGGGAMKGVAWMGVLLGFAILCDYSGAPLALAFGVWVLWMGWRAGGAAGGVRWATAFTLGALPMIALLFFYQWKSFGNPFLPAQVYMPETRYSVSGWNGFVWPNAELLMQNLFDPRFGLFAFSPVLAAAIAAPFVKRPYGPTRAQLWLIFGTSAALYIFISSVQFAFLQWNTGVRYIVPAVPLLFFALVPVLLRLPRWALYLLVVPTIAISWAVSMTRASVTEALARVFLRGPELPWLTVLEKTSAGYAPFLADGASPVMLFVVIGIVLWLVWRRAVPAGGSSQPL